MSEVQRARIVDAAAEILGELGYCRITVAQIAGRAGISRKTFYEHFEEREGCFIAAIEGEGTRGRRRASGGAGRWYARGGSARSGKGLGQVHHLPHTVCPSSGCRAARWE